MTVDPRRMMAFAVPEAVQTLTPKDAILYALSIGYGSKPLDAAHLRHIQEHGLVATPTLANVTAHPGPWMKQTGVDWDRLVHAEHRLTIHRPLPLETSLASRSRMLSVVDRGPGKGMFAAFERVIHAVGDAAPLATVIQTNACRGDGGCGSAGVPPEPLPAPPERAPDSVFEIDIPENAAALYRLNGDLNPLHIDPAAAARGGFSRPLLHGLCTFGLAGYAIARACADQGLADLAAIAARFSAPAYPGDRLQVRIWREGRDIQFRGLAPERGATVLDYGTATLR
jgi:acyl dehydratase